MSLVIKWQDSSYSRLNQPLLFNCKVHGIPANTLRKSNVILRFYFGNLFKLLSVNIDDT